MEKSFHNSKVSSIKYHFPNRNFQVRPIDVVLAANLCSSKLNSELFFFFFLSGVSHHTVEGVERFGGGEAAMGVRAVRFGRRRIDKQGRDARRRGLDLRNAGSLHATANRRAARGRSRTRRSHLPREHRF